MLLRRLSCAAGAALLLLVVGTSSAGGSAPTSLTIFGDSLSDTGNVDDLTFGISPGGSYFDGRFSNGPLWIEAASAELGLGSVIPSRDGGRNYAHGGAETGAGSTLVVFFSIPRLGRQVNTYLGSHTPAAGEMFVVWGGANNFLDEPSADPAGPVGDIVDHITTLASAGASRFFVPNLPRLGQTPRYVGTSDELVYDSLTTQFNDLLAPQLDALATTLGVSIVQFDVERLFDQLLDDPTAYGLTNVTDEAINGAANPDEYLFWDDVHPTRAAHAFLGLAAADAMAGVIAHDWAAAAATGRFDVAANWGPVGLPAAHWQTTLSNDVSVDARTAVVIDAQVVDSAVVSGVTGSMRLEAAVGGSLRTVNGLTVNAGGVLAGEGVFVGAVDNIAGRVEPGGDGQVGVLTTAGTYAQGSAAVLSVELSSSGHDVLSVVADGLAGGGEAGLGGTLAVALIDGYVPTAPSGQTGGVGDAFSVLTATSIVGEFDAASGLDYDDLAESGRTLRVRYESTGLSSAAVVLEAFQYAWGDTDLDGDVDNDDIFLILGANKFGGGQSSAMWAEGDFDDDGDVDNDDVFLILGTNLFGAGTYAAVSEGMLAAGGAAIVPEPATAWLLAAGVCMVGCRTCRGRSLWRSLW